MSRIMVSWIGNRDLGADAQTDPGPILRFLRHELGQGFQAVFLFNDIGISPRDQTPSSASRPGSGTTRSPEQFLDWLAEYSGCHRDKLNLIHARESLSDDLSRIWEFMSDELQKLANRYAGDDFAFLLSSGYPEARTAWHVASQTIFRPRSVKLYKASKERDVEEVIVPFELSVGQVLKRVEGQRFVADEKAVHGLIGRSRAIETVKQQVLEIAPYHSEFRVLLLGERGTGKDLVAQALHEASPRRDKPFIPLNCAAITQSLADSELFGVEENVATGVVARAGSVSNANHGTLFLDEIGLMPLDIQAKLLRFLQSGAYRPVGAKQESTADVWVIAATNRDLNRDADAGRFLPDLLDRLDDYRITIAPLRHRRDDVPLLSQHFLDRWNGRRQAAEQDYSKKEWTAEALRALQQYEWPGNVRELESRVRLLALKCASPQITEADVRHRLGQPVPEILRGGPLQQLSADGFLNHCAAVFEELLDRYCGRGGELPIERDANNYDLRTDVLLPLLYGRALQQSNSNKAEAGRRIARRSSAASAQREYTSIELQRGEPKQAVERYQAWVARGLLDESLIRLARSGSDIPREQ